MSSAEQQVIKLNNKMIKSYFGNLLRNSFRKMLNRLSKTLILFANSIVQSERNPKKVLKNYDEIAGIYIENYKKAYAAPKDLLVLAHGKPTLMKHDTFLENKTNYIVQEVFSLPGINSILEVGAGEATTLAPALLKFSQTLSRTAALDLSWSRMAFAKAFCSSLNAKVDHFVVGDAYHLPFADNSFDLVYTYHCLEQMPAQKERSLSELYRVARKYLVLIEPSYEFGNWPQRLRWRNKEYIRSLPKAIKRLGLNMTKHEQFAYTDYPNSAALHMIEKNSHQPLSEEVFICPETKSPLKMLNGHYFCKETGVIYPVIDGVNILEKNNAIIASKFGKVIV